MTKNRLLAFSDGVFAILITILVLEFTVPQFQTGHLLTAMIKQWPILVAYIVSYFYVGTLWLFHHDYFQALKSIDRRLNLINLLMLFSITLINYPMALVAETISRENNNDIRIAFIAYAVIALFISGTFHILYRYTGKHPDLKSERMQQADFSKSRFDPLISMSLYVLAIISSLFLVPLGAIFLLAGIGFHFVAYLHLSNALGQK
ncbi:TMEM175 family protein [Companilactobacillus nantensis]|uniref:Hypothetical membrane protein, duf1211 family n=1 Tax=Companilactobacillus nantensis DSM 16982 TaxID=1423774 RepID=A0A0R1WAF6_9LACO|nr:TMEM175 family protein [Companilactobacillus nantensis]KRM14926.1 hypothetical membrane protein, duf1211 family [Companilactobacillus nantensis DSM 16982]GEO64983.1 DUF1211 domain-containing membrane protein [Companilactobacillus nantensis]